MQIRIVQKKISEDCFADTVVYDYELSDPITCEQIFAFKNEKEFNYYTHFPIPMFKVITSSNIHIKGLLNTTQCRVIYPSDVNEEEIARIEMLICFRDKR